MTRIDHYIIKEVAELLDVYVDSAHSIILREGLPYVEDVRYLANGRKIPIRYYPCDVYDEFAKTYVNKVRKPRPKNEPVEYTRGMRLNLIRQVHNRVNKTIQGE